MRITLIVAALLVAYATADKCPVLVALEEAMDKCAKKLDASEETMSNIKDDKPVDDRETNCMRFCMMQEAGFMSNDAKMDIDKMQEMMESGKDPNYEAIKTVTDGMRDCKSEAETSADGCDVAGNYATCYRAKKEKSAK